jgi:membrane-bound lytic murein transglycosylase A
MANSAPRKLAFATAAGLILILVGIAWLWFNRVPAPAFVLTPVSFAELPGWRRSDVRIALAAFRRSCTLLTRQEPVTTLGGAGYAGVAGDWRAACAAAPLDDLTATAARSYFETRFTVFEVVSYGSPQALFTGYYEPQLRVSPTRRGPYETPVYGLPSDLISVDLGLFHASLKGDHVSGRIAGRALVPYYTRAEIDAHGLKSAPVLGYSEDPIAVFFLQIQGSGRALLDNGQIVRLAYAGQNGRPYTPIGRTLIEKWAVSPDRMSMQAIRQWLLAHPAAAQAVMDTDQSFVFFREAALGDPSLGSLGSEGVPLTPGASIAVDVNIHALGVPFFIAASAPDPDSSHPDDPLNRLFIAQDTGGAIRGAARADVFWGFGRASEAIAGRMKSLGRLYVLLPNGLASRIKNTKLTRQ